VLRNRIAVKIAFFLNGFIYANWGSRLPRIQELYNASDGTIALVLFAMSLGAVAGMPFTGWVIIKNGSRRITLAALILYCIFVPLIPFMPNLGTLMALYLIMGITTGMLDVAMNAQAVMIETAYKRPIMTSFHALFSIGMALGAWCGVLFAKLEFDLSAHLSSIVIVSLMAAFWVSRNLVHDKPDPSLKEEGPLFRIPNRALLSVGIIAFCCMMGEGAMSEWTVNYMENIALASEATAPIALSAFATAMTLGRIFGDRIRAAWGDTKLIMFGGVLASLGLALCVGLPHPWTVIAGAFLVGLGLSTIVPIAYSIAGNEKGLPSGVGLAMVTTVGYSGFLFGAPIIGFIADQSNLRIGLSVVIILFLIMTFLGFTRMRAQNT
jgi:MFS family permease